MQPFLATQPEPYHQLIKRSLRLYRATLAHTILLALLLAIIAFIPRFISIITGKDIFSGILPTNPEQLWFLLDDLICLIVFTAILWRIQCVIQHTHETLFDDLKRALRKLPRIFIAALIQMLVISIIGFSIFFLLFFLNEAHLITFFVFKKQIIVPMNATSTAIRGGIALLESVIIIYLFFAFYFYLPLILTENQTILGSLKRSTYLVWGNWWKVFTVQLTPWISYLICLIILRFGINIDIHIFFVASNSSWLISLFQILLFAVFIPWFATTLLVQLHDLELRKKLIPPA